MNINFIKHYSNQSKTILYIRSIVFIFVSIFAPLSNALSLNESSNFRLIVSVDYLLSIKKQKNVIVVDVRDKNRYLKDHIVNARNIPISATFGLIKKDRVAPLPIVQSLIQQAGITENSWVVFYDSGTLIDAARMFWVFEFYGHNKVSILDGGYQQWNSAGFETEKITNKNYKPSNYIANIQPDKYTSQLNMRLAIDNDSMYIIDSREAAEYRGEKSITNKFGRIPNSNSIPWSRNFDNFSATGNLKSTKDLIQIYKNIDKKKHVITYCNKGKQSSLTYFILRRLGFDVSHYDGSWFEWSSKEKLPIEK